MSILIVLQIADIDILCTVEIEPNQLFILIVVKIHQIIAGLLAGDAPVNGGVTCGSAVDRFALTNAAVVILVADAGIAFCLR